MRNATRLIGLILLLPFIPGLTCIFLPSPPGEEAVLSGIWELVPSEPENQPRIFLTFDSRGQLTELRATFGQTTVTNTRPNGSADVSGSNVTITLESVLTFSNLVFEGTFNEAKTSAAGNLRTEIRFGSTIISTDEGPATLNKQP